MRTYQVISADGHVEVPLDFAARVPAKYRDLAPRLVTKDDGTEWWRMDQWERENSGNLVCELDYDQFESSTCSYHNPDGSCRPGTGDAVQRLREQDQDGIDAEVLFPAVYGPAFLRNMIGKDKGAYLSIVQAYNTFLAEEYCSVAPDRLIGNGMVPETGVDDAIAEMERCRKIGLPSVSLSMWPNGGPGYAPDDDRFFAASLDIGMKMSPHVTFGGAVGVSGPSRDFMMAGEGRGTFTIGQLILRGVFDKFTKLKFHFAETQAGWLPYNLIRVDEAYLRWYHYYDIQISRMPSEYYRDHCRFSFTSDRLAVKYRYDIGLDLLFWGSDFPHAIGTFPYSRSFLDEVFEDVPQAEKRKVLVDNLVDFYDLDPQRELTPTP